MILGQPLDKHKVLSSTEIVSRRLRYMKTKGYENRTRSIKNAKIFKKKKIQMTMRQLTKMYIMNNQKK